MDQQFIELFDTRNVIADPLWLPAWPEIVSDGIAVRLVHGGFGRGIIIGSGESVDEKMDEDDP